MPRFRSETISKNHAAMGAAAGLVYELDHEALANYAVRWGPSHCLSSGQDGSMRGLLLNLAWLDYRTYLDGWPLEVSQCWSVLDEDPADALVEALRVRDYYDDEMFADEHRAVAELFEGLGNSIEACDLMEFVLKSLEAEGVAGRVKIDVLSRLQELQQQAGLAGDRPGTTDALIKLLEAEEDVDEEELLAAQSSHVEALAGAAYFADAIELSEQVLARARALYADEPEMCMAYVHNHADTLMSANQAAEAIPLYEEALGVFEEVQGPDSEDVRLALSGLAQCHFGTLKAVELEREVLARTERDLGPDDHQVAVVCHSLSCALQFHDVDEALAFAERAEVISARLWGPGHLATLEHVALQGRLLLTASEPAEALKRFEVVHEAQERRLGPDNPGLKDSFENLAKAHKALEQFEAARECAEQALLRDEQLNGAEHPHRIFALGPLLSLYELLERSEDADRIFAEADALLDEEDATDLQVRLDLIHDYCLEWAEIRRDLELLGELAQEGVGLALTLEEAETLGECASTLSWVLLEDEDPASLRQMWADITEDVMAFDPLTDEDLFAVLNELLEVMEEGLPKDPALHAVATTLFEVWSDMLSADEGDADTYDEVIAEYAERLQAHATQ